MPTVAAAKVEYQSTVSRSKQRHQTIDLKTRIFMSVASEIAPPRQFQWTLRVHARRHGWGSPKCLPIAASTEPIYRQVAEEVTAETAEGNKAWEAHVAGLWETQHYDLRSRRRPVKPPTAACSFHEDVPEGTKPRDRDFSLAEAWGPTRTRARTAVERERRARYTP